MAQKTEIVVDVTEAMRALFSTVSELSRRVTDLEHRCNTFEEVLLAFFDNSFDRKGVKAVACDICIRECATHCGTCTTERAKQIIREYILDVPPDEWRALIKP